MMKTTEMFYSMDCIVTGLFYIIYFVNKLAQSFGNGKTDQADYRAVISNHANISLVGTQT